MWWVFSVEVFYEKVRQVTTKVKMENMKARKEINVEQFIVEWEKHQCLWNVTSEEYKDRNLRENTLENLKESFQISGK